MKKRKYSLSIHITSLFLILAILLGGGLIAISYYHSQELLAQIARELSKESSQKLENTFQKDISPILTTLDLMATSTLPNVPISNEAEHDWLKSIQLIFERNRELVALFYGDSNGDSTQFRPIRDKYTRELLGASKNSAIMLNYTDTQGRNDFLFYNKRLKKILARLSKDNKYDPRIRPWYTNAKPDGAISLTAPYDFYYLKTVGVTLSRLSIDGNTVVAADLTLDSLSKKLGSIAVSSNTKLALFDSQFKLLAGHNLVKPAEDGSMRLGELEETLFSDIIGRNSSNTLYSQTDYEGKPWSVTLTPVNLTKHIRLLLAEATPEEDLLFDLLSMRDKQIGAAVLMLFASFIVIWFTAKRLALPLKTLNQLTENIRGFHFKKTRYPKSIIREVDELTHSVELMEHTLHDLLGLLRDTASNHNFEQLTKTISKQSYLITKAETIVLSILDKEDNQFITAVNHSIIPFKIGINQLIGSTPWMRAKLESGDVIHITKNDNAIKGHADIFYNAEIFLFPMLNRHNKLAGILTVGYERPCNELQKDKHVFLKELLNFAEIAKENIDQMQQQKEMFTSFIELIASAIDTKSPYTGLHCQRVPEIVRLLAKAADNDKAHFADFEMNDEKWEELDFAAWLHDCGKVTTPEFVVDKATKLETIYDRIHEVRMRFELLKSQAEANCWQQIAEGADPQKAKQALTETHSRLDEEFELIAECNIGNKEMTHACQEQLERIASQTWTRTIDDQLGVSRVEKERAGPPRKLPATECLLDDKDIHQIPWEEGHDPFSDWQDEYNLKPSDVQYNRGELHNLSVIHGTLTSEERFMINNHIIQTLELLKRLPYPEHLKGVPEIAGNHHERVDGKGYPRGLTSEQLSIPAKMMAIADIFEAITTPSRPYKESYTIDKALSIMTEQAVSGHIDPYLFLLFLEKEIYKTYAEKYLSSEQMSDVNLQQHIKRVKDYIGE